MKWCRCDFFSFLFFVLLILLFCTVSNDSEWNNKLDKRYIPWHPEFAFWIRTKANRTLWKFYVSIFSDKAKWSVCRMFIQWQHVRFQMYNFFSFSLTFYLVRCFLRRNKKFKVQNGWERETRMPSNKEQKRKNETKKSRNCRWLPIV